MRVLVVNLFALFYVTAGFNLCPHQKHLEGAVNKCRGKLPSLGEKSEQLAHITALYEKQCVDDLVPGASNPEVQRMRCSDHHFEKQFYRCWSGVLDDERLLSDAGFTNEDVHIFKESIKCKFGVLGIEI
ncbi:unnamed protein product [Ixodes hexagonus]